MREFLEKRLGKKLKQVERWGMTKSLSEKLKLVKFEEKRKPIDAIPIMIVDILTDPNNYYIDYLDIDEMILRISGMARAYLEGIRAIEKDMSDTLDETALFPLKLLRFLAFDPILYNGEITNDL